MLVNDQQDVDRRWDFAQQDVDPRALLAYLVGSYRPRST